MEVELKELDLDGQVDEKAYPLARVELHRAPDVTDASRTSAVSYAVLKSRCGP